MIIVTFNTSVPGNSSLFEVGIKRNDRQSVLQFNVKNECVNSCFDILHNGGSDSAAFHGVNAFANENAAVPIAAIIVILP